MYWLDGSSAFVFAILFVCSLPYASAQTCISFGIDFVDGGSYFQNSLSTDDFTFVSEYEGCNSDNASNILVAPTGDEWLCSSTPLQPADTPELSTCPIEKAQLFSGAWSILTISNNGDGDPIAYERDFSLVVGPQQTVTITPTVTVSATYTPVVNSTSTSVVVTTSVLTPSTITSPATVIHKTTTVTPKPSTTTTTKVLATLTRFTKTVTISQIVKTATASCSHPKKTKVYDFHATITPSLITPRALPTSKWGYGPRPRRSDRSREEGISFGKAEGIEKRKNRMAGLQKRAPGTSPNPTQLQLQSIHTFILQTS